VTRLVASADSSGEQFSEVISRHKKPLPTGARLGGSNPF
jgi:hypothetical protein